MTNEGVALITAVLVLGGRIWSMFEHRQTGKAVAKTDKDIMQIKIYINGELHRKLEEARQEGRDEEKLKTK